MAHRVLTETAVSIPEHKKNPMATVAAGEGMAVAVLNRSVRIIDWLDLCHPVPQRMWERRLRGYRAMGCALISDP